MPNTVTADAKTADQTIRLWTPSFLGLLCAQALGSMNDNMFRWLFVGVAKARYEGDPASQSVVVAIGSIGLTLPYLLLAAPAGFAADRFPKRRVIVNVKAAEFAIMVAGIFAIASGSLPAIFAALALLGAHSALYSPARAASIPELMHPEAISRANGWFGLTNLMSVILGTVLGNVLADRYAALGNTQLVWIATASLSVAGFGWLAALRIAPRPAGNPAARWSWNFFSSTWIELRELFQQPALRRVALGIMFFWSLAALANVNIDQLVREGGATQQSQNNAFLVCLTLGVGVGSVLAGYWSGERVELGILPLGAFGVILASLLLYFVHGELFVDQDGVSAWTGAHYVVCGLLFARGASAGMFDVPLESYMQQNSPVAKRGAILAAVNFMTFGGMIAVSGLYMILRMPIETSPGVTRSLLSARQIFLVCGVATAPILIYILWLLPQACLRFAIWLTVKCLYRVRTVGAEHIPRTGPVLLASNHVSFLDAVLIILTCPRPVRMFAWAGNLQNPLMKKLSEQWGVIPVTNNPKAIVRALKTARQALLDGEVVCIFPEGAITRSGNLGTFKSGILKIHEGTAAPIVTVYLDQLWGSIFSFSHDKFFWKVPRRWRYPVDVAYGWPLTEDVDATTIRNAVMRLGAESVTRRLRGRKSLAYEAIVGCRRRLTRPKFADSTGVDLTGGQTLARAIALRRALKRVLKPDERRVSVMLPSSAAGMLANFALTLEQRTVVNLNYTCSAAILNDSLKLAGIRSVVTSRKFLDKVEIMLDANMILLEDIRDRVTWFDRLVAGFQAFLLPTRLLGAWLGVSRTLGDEPASVIFTSGSTGAPKGVVLTHGNIAANVEAIDQIVHLRADDVLIGILPFFHALGSTVTIWAALILDLHTAYHFSPLDPKQVGKLCRERKGTIMLTTPTFLRSYLKRCDTEDFRTLNTVVTGAERLSEELAKAFEKKYGVLPVEGYGTTELSPLGAVNIPPGRSADGIPLEARVGTVGRPVPGACAKIVDPESGIALAVGQEGILWMTGANVMSGYLDCDDLTAQRRRRRLVRHRRHGANRRRWIYYDRWAIEPLFENRRRDGPARFDRRDAVKTYRCWT
ncbi:MAG: MFS transporter [Pirellulales bacterium]